MFDKLPKIVHQIWIGDKANMSQGVCACVDSVVRWCSNHGIEYKLWDWDELRAEFALDKVTDIFEKALELNECVKTYVIMSDYYRWAVTAKFGGLYLDTDFFINSMPELPEADIIYCKPHYDDTPGNGLLWCVGERGMEAAKIGLRLLKKWFKNEFKDVPFEEAYKDMLNRNTAWENIGPSFLIDTINPAIEKEGYKWDAADKEQCNCSGKGDAPFWHMGERAWKGDDTWIWKLIPDPITGNVTLKSIRKVKLILGICSCKYNADKRIACRNTWARNLDHNKDLDIKFFYAGDMKDARRDEILLECGDGYYDLPEKVFKFFEYCLNNYEFDYLFKCDDDTYCAVDRLMELVNTMDDPARGFKAYDIKSNQDHLQGGAGYLLSRETVEKILALGIPDNEAEDVCVYQNLTEAGITITFDGGFYPKNDKVPTKENHQITCHKVSPRQMIQIHDEYTK